MLATAIEARRRLGGSHPNRRAAGAIACGVSVGLGFLSGMGVHFEAVQSVTAGKGTLTEVASITPEVCGGEMVTHITNDKAAWHYKVKIFGATLPNIASFSESYTADIGGKICATQTAEIPAKYDPNKKKFVVNIDAKSAFSMTLFEKATPTPNWVPGNNIIAAELSNVENLIKAIPGLDSQFTDSKHNALQNIARLEAFRVVSHTCGPLALKHLTDPNAPKTNLQKGPNAPTSIQGQIIDNMVANANALEIRTHEHFTPDDFEVDITQDALSIPSQYDADIARIQKIKPDSLSLPNLDKIQPCVDAVGNA